MSIHMRRYSKELHVSFRSIAGLYDSDDPYPENIRGLSDQAEDQIALVVEEKIAGLHPRDLPALSIGIPPSELTEDRKTSIPSAVRAHFLRRAENIEREKKRSIRVGLREFRLTVAVCIPSFAGIALASRYEHNPLALVIQNFVVIFCWVVIWQPFQSLIFDRWTLSTQAKIYRIIARMQISLCETSDLP